MIWRVLLACLALAACGTASENNPALGQISDRLQGNVEDFTPRFIDRLRAEAEVLQVGFPDQGTNGNLLLERRDGDFEYWLSPDGVHVVTQSGMLHSVRGLGDGLLASEITEPLALVRGMRAGTADRFHTYLDGEDFAVSRTFRCVIAQADRQSIDLQGRQVATILMQETCRSLDMGFENFYWVRPGTRRIVLSRQWAGPETGALSTRAVLR